jgi:hypothetical protein
MLNTGCPPASSSAISVGVWLFAVEGQVFYVGAEFIPGGQMDEFGPGNHPPGANAVFSGTLTWQQMGTTITILQDLGGNGRTYTGILENTTYMTGTWVNIIDANDTGTFIAAKAPSG